MQDTNFDLQLFASGAAVVGSKNPADLSLPAGEWSFKNFSRAANPYQVFRTLGHCSAATQTWNVNTVEKRDATRGTRELIAQAETQRDLSLSITMDQWDPINVALACWGETALKKIPAKQYARSYVVSPGDELYLPTDNDETPAYNYTGLTITRAIGAQAKIRSAVLDAQGAITAPTGTLQTSGAYTGAVTGDYYVQVIEANPKAQDISGLKFIWKFGMTGAYSTAIAATTSAQELEKGVFVNFVLGTTGQDFHAGDEWKIRVVAAGGALVKGADYSADETDIATGKVRFPTDAGIHIDETVNVSYSVPEQIIPRVYAGVRKTVEGQLRFQADPTVGRRLFMLYYHVKFAPNGDLTLVGEDFSSAQVTATVLADAQHASSENPDSRYYHMDYVGDTTGILVKED